MKIFIDFDDVLFNTKRFKEDYYEIFRKNGISKEVLEKCYYEPMERVGEIDRYDPAGHVERMCRANNIATADLQEDMLGFIADTKRYIFEDVEGFLGSFKKEELCIVSFSDTEFQRFKIFNSGIAGNFQDIEIVNELKAKAIGKIIKKKGLSEDEHLYFIDDRVEQIGDVKERFPQIKTILMKRKEGRYKDQKNKYCDFECSSLKQVKKIIKTNGK